MKTMHKLLVTACTLFVGVAFAQTQTKEYKESFNVNKDVIVNVNTVNANVVFDSWNQNKVEVVATIEVEGLSKEDAEEFLSSWNFEAMGNSSKVNITADGGNVFGANQPGMFVFNNGGYEPYMLQNNVGNFQFFIDDSFEDLVEDVIDPEMIIMLDSLNVPPPPEALMQLGNVEFDYEAFQKDGEAYMAKWQKQWAKNFDKDKVEKEMKEWARKLAERREAIAKRQAENQKRQAVNRERQAAMRKKQEAMREKQAAMRDKQAALQQRIHLIRTSSFSSDNGEGELIIKKNGETIHVKIKKKIEIKIPKDAKLQLNIRHGEVKLADNATNINATLSYSRLLAQNIYGPATTIEASYAPVKIGKWNDGKLVLNFAEDVKINTAKNITLYTNSSDVVIQRLDNKADIYANLGTFRLNEINPSFNKLILKLDSMDSYVKLPGTDYLVTLHLNNSRTKLPNNWQYIKNYNDYKEGYHLKSDSVKKIYISSLFSNLTFN